MTAPRKFLLDADTFMSAHRQYYRFSFCPAYWHALLVHHENKQLASIEPVRKELLRGKDALAAWVKEKAPKTFFKGIEDTAVVKAFADLNQWVATRPELTPEARARFAGAADGWLVAYAQVNNYAVCTYEVSRPESRANIKLPDVAVYCGVSCLTPHDMLEELGVRMVLSKRTTKSEGS
jgi:hypothetical protein